MSGADVVTLVIQFVVVSALAFVVICLLASILRFQGMAMQAQEYDASSANGDDAFHATIARSMSQRVGEAHSFCVGIVSWGDSEDPAARIRVIEQIRDHLRPADRVFQLESGALGMVLNMPMTGIAPAFHRLQPRLPSDARIGLSSFPEHGDRLDPLLDQALAAQAKAEPGERVLAGSDAATDPAPTESPGGLEDIPEDQRQFVDPHSGLLKEADVPAAIQKLVATARRYGDPLSVLALAIEHGERYQEHYGEEGIQAMLAHVGRLVRTGVRERDMPGQGAGLQFVVVLDAGLEQAQEIARRLIEQTRAEPCQVGSSRLPLNLNCGVAAYPPHGQTGKQLLQRAQVALQHASAKGRGTCSVYSPQQDASKPSLRDSSQEVF